MRIRNLIALCDILGFSKLVESQALDTVVDQGFGWIRQSLYHSLYKEVWREDIPILAEFQRHDNVGVAWFSDTILLYTRNDTDEAVCDLLQTVSWLLFETMWSPVGPRIRAGVSYGEMFIDSDNSVFVGKPIVEAHQLERDQEWAGAALTQAACNRLPELYRTGRFIECPVVPYSVPLKNDRTCDTLAVNWTVGIHDLRSKLRWSASCDLPTEEALREMPDVCRKFMNTLAFHSRLCESCKPATRNRSLRRCPKCRLVCHTSQTHCAGCGEPLEKPEVGQV